MNPQNEEHAEAFAAEQKQKQKHGEWLAKSMGRSEWLDLLMRCQNGECTCLYAMEKIEHELDKAVCSSPEAHMLLRSAYEIADRDGKDTNWDAFRKSLLKELLAQAHVPKELLTDEQTILRATCTARVYRALPGSTQLPSS